MKYKIVIFFVLTCMSCQKKDENLLHHFQGWAMTMPYHITIGHPLTSKEKDLIYQDIQEIFHLINTKFNNFNPDSELSKLNTLPANQPHLVSTEFELFFEKIDAIIKVTENRFDPTVAPLVNLWKKGESAIEGQKEKIKTLIGWEKIHLSHGLFTKDRKEISLDFCGVAKGYCIDLIMEKLQKRGFDNLFVEWAGEIRTSGQHPTGRNWNVQIQPLGYNHSIPLKNAAIATSGDYTVKPNTWEKNPTCHIMNPLTKKPMYITKESIACVTVIAPSCALADAFATAVMTFETKKQAVKWVEKQVEENPDLHFWIFSHDRENL